MRSGVVVVRGEAGIGKTRLAREVLERARAAGARTASCAALELGGPAPYSMWSELLRDLADDLALPRPMRPGPTTSPSSHRHCRAGSAARPSRTAARPRPSTHDRGCSRRRWTPSSTRAPTGRSSCCSTTRTWPTPPSLELLAYVLRRFTGLGVLAILTCRTTPQRPDLDALLRAHVGRGGELLELDVLPLPRGDVERLVASVAELLPEQRAQVIAAADGNPLLAIEGARAAGAGRDGPPESLQAVVRAAVGRLPDGARRAAELAAVAGRDLTLTEVGALASQEDVLRALDCGLLTAEHGDFGYRHALLRDAALADMPEPRRRGAARGAGRRAARPAAETARHLRLAGRDDLAAGRLAGRRATPRRSAPSTRPPSSCARRWSCAPATPRSRSSSRPRRPTAAAGSPPRTRCG